MIAREYGVTVAPTFGFFLDDKVCVWPPGSSLCG